MALPVNIETLLSGKVVEWERLDFKRGWNPEDVLHSTCAFANDVNNWGGGYIIVGVDEINGIPVLPPVGVDISQIDRMQKEMVNLLHQIVPAPVAIMELVSYAGTTLLVIWVPGGEQRPYKAAVSLGKESAKQGKRYYIRKGSVTCVAQGEDERRLMMQASKVPFDDRICHQASLRDLDMMLIRDHLRKIQSNISDDEAIRMPFKDLCWSLQLIGGSTEYIRPKNFALLFFCDNPEKFIPYARIEVVVFHDDIGDKFDEKIFHGPIHKQYAEVMSFMRSQVVTEKVIKVEGRAEAMRAFNYPYAALEEVIANAIYHKSYDDRNPIEIRVNPDSIQVYSLEGPMPPLRAKDLKEKRVVSRNYRNRRIGDILKELDITEGRSTGFPKIYNAMRKNGSPEPSFETDEDNSFFLATIPIHPAFANDGIIDEAKGEAKGEAKNGTKNDAKNIVKNNIGKDAGIQLINTDKRTDNVKNDANDIIRSGTKDGTKGEAKDEAKNEAKNVTERQEILMTLLKQNPFITQSLLARKLNVSRITIYRELNVLQNKGLLRREGSRANGRWIVCQAERLRH